jgi:hypothetical protein
MTSEAEELARFCAELAEIRRLLRGPASAAHRALVEQAVRAARRGEPVGPLLERLRGGTAPPAQPVPGSPYRGAPSPLPPPVFDAGAGPVTGVYVCPGDVCSRVEVRSAGSAVPSCDIHERALRFVADHGYR